MTREVEDDEAVARAREKACLWKETPSIAGRPVGKDDDDAVLGPPVPAPHFSDFSRARDARNAKRDVPKGLDAGEVGRARNGVVLSDERRELAEKSARRCPPGDEPGGRDDSPPHSPHGRSMHRLSREPGLQREEAPLEEVPRGESDGGAHHELQRHGNEQCGEARACEHGESVDGDLLEERREGPLVEVDPVTVAPDEREARTAQNPCEASVRHLSDIGQPDSRAVLITDDERLVVGGVRNLVVSKDVGGHHAVGNLAFGHVSVL